MADEINVTGVDFVVVAATDFEESCRFYEDVLGLEPSQRYGERPGQEYETGDLTLAVMQSDAFGMEFRANSPIALRVDDVASTRAALEAKGVEFHFDTIDSGVCHMAPFSDPAGNHFILHQRYAPRN